jgi:putative transposase
MSNSGELGWRIYEGFVHATYYLWKRNYGAMEVSDVRRLRMLEDENSRFNRLVANHELDIAVLKENSTRKW